MTDLEADPSVKVVVFQSANPDFFIAHLDVSKAAERPEVLGLWRDFVLRLSSTPVVSIAKIRGRTRGIGNEFVLACDMIERYLGCKQRLKFTAHCLCSTHKQRGSALSWRYDALRTCP